MHRSGQIQTNWFCIAPNYKLQIGKGRLYKRSNLVCSANTITWFMYNIVNQIPKNVFTNETVRKRVVLNLKWEREGLSFTRRAWAPSNLNLGIECRGTKGEDVSLRLITPLIACHVLTQHYSRPPILLLPFNPLLQQVRESHAFRHIRRQPNRSATPIK